MIQPIDNERSLPGLAITTPGVCVCNGSVCPPGINNSNDNSVGSINRLANNNNLHNSLTISLSLCCGGCMHR